ncbi:uncharacterized protein LOC113550019 [Rhopalosiphum maidis]|uniref:uncharacterized protein LOC113550019 n=1 Tax=Rhopalosiphum maidis TaxID=43146 RepID=UPI000EFFB6D9|nr:uncharacterized protein LOC113550019 [Rhopalosiphum maidis]
MHILIASCILIVCGIVDATFHNQRGQRFNQLIQRRQRSLEFPYPYGYNYNPIEPSIDVLDSSIDIYDSKINTYKPIHEYVKMSTRGASYVPTFYYPPNSLYDSDYTPVQDIPKLIPDKSYDYKYIASPSNKYLSQLSTPESNIAINLLANSKASVLSYEIPAYQSSSKAESGLNFNSKILNTIFINSQSVETNPEISKVSSPSVVILELLPEKLEQESTTTTIENLYETMNFIEKLLEKQPILIQNSVIDESSYAAETTTENESNSMVFNENPTENQLYSVATEDESNSMIFDENLTENQSYSTTTEDESNSMVFDENTTENQSYSITTEDESNSIPTEDESNAIATEDELNSIPTEDESNSITTEENQTEHDESNPETLVSEINDDVFNDDWSTKSQKNSDLEIMELLQRYKKLEEQMKPMFMTDISSATDATVPSSLASDENKQLELRVPAFEETETSDEYQ